jgi:crotonobetainyl-CoA:carnitine CoA-transferase CaiB-like acyl-CoA transferase
MAAQAGERSGPLVGLEVLDLSWGIAGPMATMLLADSGARVTRVEPPAGDPHAEQSGSTVWHRGKRSAQLDLRTEAGREAFLALARRADVVVDSFSPGTTDRLGVGPDVLRAINPRIVTCAITGYGRGNRHSDRPGYDALVMARTGLFHDQRGRRGGAMEFANGRPGPLPEFDAPDEMRRGTSRPGPVFPRSTWPSLAAAYLASLGIAGALRARELTGVGQHVETSLLQGALAAVALNWQRVEHPDAPLYWMWPIDSRSIEGLYECADGRWVHHWVVRPQWVRSVSAGDRLVVPDREHDYRADPDRLGMGPEDLVVGTVLHPTLAEAFRRFPSADWVRVAEESEMGVALVRSPAEALADPAYLADGCVVEVDDPKLGPIRHVGPVLEFGATPAAVVGPAPLPGEHTDEVLAEARAVEAATAPAPAKASSPSTSSSTSSSPTSTSAALPRGPLDGIRVLDLGLGVAGPFGPKMLADLGADVVKVHALHDTFWAGTHMGLGTNRGKRSISLDLKDPRGIAALHALIDGADVVATNWRPGAAARLGIDYETLHARHPRLVFCNTRGYERGPRSDLPGTDQTAAALTGVEWEDGACDHGNPPLWSRSGMGDTGNAFLAAIAITQALVLRERTGVGQDVSTSIVNADLFNASYAWIHADGTPGSWAHVDAGQHGLSALYRMYETSDGWIAVAVVTERHWTALVAATGLGELAADPRFASAAGRRADDAALAAALEPVLRSRTASEWFAALDGADVPAEIVDEDFCRTVFDDEDLRARGWIAETWAGGVGRFEDPGVLVDLSQTPGSVQRGPCLCGEHTRELLREIGYADAEIDVLVADRVVLDAPVERPGT